MKVKEYSAPEARLLNFDAEDSLMNFLAASQNNAENEVSLEWE